jgi:DNA topoisomerase IA
VDFQARGSNGSFISNLVSQGKDEQDLYLTFYFEWTLPEIEAGSEEEKNVISQRWEMVKEVVQETIDIGREMVKDGKIKL